jgi:beta-lactam-binding protein with PASTA domain
MMRGRPERQQSRRMRPRRLAPSVLAAALVLSFAGCGGDDDESLPGAPTTGPGSATTAPDAIGTDIADAAEDFADAGLRVSIDYIPSNEPSGTVATQANPAGTELQRGDTVGLGVSTGTSTAGNLRVPDVTGQPEPDATDALEKVGFEVLSIDVAAVEGDDVIFQSPTAGGRAPLGALVVLYAGT